MDFCVYISMKCCRKRVLVSNFCSSLVKFVTLICRPFYLLLEITSMFIISVYISASANANEVLCEILRAISELQNAHADGLFIVARDNVSAPKILSIFGPPPQLHNNNNNLLCGMFCWRVYERVSDKIFLLFISNSSYIFVYICNCIIQSK